MYDNVDLCICLNVCVCVCVGDGASLREGAAASVSPERLRGRRGDPGSQTNPQRSQGLESREQTSTLFKDRLGPKSHFSPCACFY